MNYAKLVLYPAIEEAMNLLIDIDGLEPKDNLKLAIHNLSEIMHQKEQFVFDIWNIRDVMFIGNEMGYSALTADEAQQVLFSIETSGSYSYTNFRGIDKGLVEDTIESLFPEKA